MTTAKLPATGPYVDRIIRIFRDNPDDDTSALVLVDYAEACRAAAPAEVGDGWRLVPVEAMFQEALNAVMNVTAEELQQVGTGITAPGYSKRRSEANRLAWFFFREHGYAAKAAAPTPRSES